MMTLTLSLFGGLIFAQTGPLTQGNGKELSDPSERLVLERAFNRLSAPDAKSCAGCHKAPYGIPGGSCDFVTSVFVIGQHFDFLTFDPTDPMPTKGALAAPVKRSCIREDA